VYYYFYESTKGIVIQSRGGSRALSALESMLAGLIAGSHLLFFSTVSPFFSKGNFFLPGSATTVISNPVWVIQAAQTVNGMDAVSGEASAPLQKRLGLRATAARLLRTGGPAAFFRGLGPALVLVVNPVLQYTVFEQLKNALVRRRRTAGRVGTLLTDWDFFFLGAISKLGVSGPPSMMK
jgi:solute carrier family 25 (peroxisomal adenine nucleotide transporter), member 17